MFCVNYTDTINFSVYQCVKTKKNTELNLSIILKHILIYVKKKILE